MMPPMQRKLKYGEAKPVLLTPNQVGVGMIIRATFERGAEPAKITQISRGQLVVIAVATSHQPHVFAPGAAYLPLYEIYAPCPEPSKWNADGTFSGWLKDARRRKLPELRIEEYRVPETIAPWHIYSLHRSSVFTYPFMIYP